MVFETVVTRRSVAECINSVDRALRNIGSARNSNNDRELLEYYDIMSAWGHNLGAALLKEWTAKAEKARREFEGRARQIGVEAAAKEAKSAIGLCKQLAENFSKSEKTSKYAALNLQGAGRSLGRRFKKIDKDIERQKKHLVRNLQDAQRRSVGQARLRRAV